MAHGNKSNSTKERGSLMQTDKKPSTFENTVQDLSQSMGNVSRSANLYGKLFMLKDMQIFLAKQEKEIQEEIDKGELVK